MSDAPAIDALVSEAARGCDDALTALYRELHGSVVGFLWGFVHDEAEDLAAESWIDVAGVLPGFRGDGPDFRRLLFTIARRRAIDHGRKRVRRRTEPMDIHELGLVDSNSDPADAVAELDGSLQAVARITALLPRPQAEVVLLRVVAGMSVPEVAAVVGRSSNAVSVLQSRGLSRLADRLTAERTGRDDRTEQNGGNPPKVAARIPGLGRLHG